jgi:tight adherence protein B
MNPTAHTAWLLTAAFLLGSAAVASVFALRVQGQQRRYQARVALVTGSREVTIETVYRNARRQTVEQTPWWQHVARVFGYDTRRAEHYKVKWWAVIASSMMLSWLGAMLVAPLAGALAFGAVPVLGIILSRSFYKMCNDRRKQALYLQFPDALAMIVRGVRVGIPMRESFAAIARECPQPTSETFRFVSDRISLGAAVEEALYELAEQNDVTEYRFFAAAIGLQAQTGGGLSETLENLADVIRRRLALRARGYALASEARASIVVLCALPFLAGFALSVINPHYIGILFSDDAGRKVFGGAVLLFGTGLTVMRQIVRKTLS